MHRPARDPRCPSKGTASGQVESAFRLPISWLRDRPQATSTADPSTLSAQVNKLRQRSGLQRLAVVGDRGMLAQTDIAADLKPADLD